MSAVPSRRVAATFAVVSAVAALLLAGQNLRDRGDDIAEVQLTAPFACGDIWIVQPLDSDVRNGWTMIPRGDPQRAGAEPIYASDDATVVSVDDDGVSSTLTLDYGQVHATYSGLNTGLGSANLFDGVSITAGQPLARRLANRPLEVRFTESRADHATVAVAFDGASGGSEITSTNCHGAAADHLRQHKPPDFDGDGVPDRLDVVANIVRIGFGASSAPVVLTDPVDMSQVAIGDFDGDGASDLFRADGISWQLSKSAVEPWKQLQESQLTLDQLLFGDLNGDSKLDVFIGDGEVWQYASGGMQPWIELRSSAVKTAELALADFDGDGSDDVFNATGRQWRYSSRGIRPWQQLSASEFVTSDVRLGDFDGDGTADVMRTGDAVYFIAWGGRPGWTELDLPDGSAEELFMHDRALDGRIEFLSVFNH